MSFPSFHPVQMLRHTTEATRPSSAARATRLVRKVFADFLYRVFMRIFCWIISQIFVKICMRVLSFKTTTYIRLSGSANYEFQHSVYRQFNYYFITKLTIVNT